MSDWTINADFRFNEGIRDGAHGKSGYTWDEYCAKTPPPCPGCGEPVDVEPIRTGGLGPDLFIPGAVTCSNGCQPAR